jgi:hypothetical protein
MMVAEIIRIVLHAEAVYITVLHSDVVFCSTACQTFERLSKTDLDIG